MKSHHEVLVDWANNARAPLRSVTLDGIADGIEFFLNKAGYIIVPSGDGFQASIRSGGSDPAVTQDCPSPAPSHAKRERLADRIICCIFIELDYGTAGRRRLSRTDHDIIYASLRSPPAPAVSNLQIAQAIKAVDDTRMEVPLGSPMIRFLYSEAVLALIKSNPSQEGE